MAGGIPAFDLGGVTLGVREGVIALIVLVACYMAFVIWRMRRLRQPKAAAPVSVPSLPPEPLEPVVPQAVVEAEAESVDPLPEASAYWDEPAPVEPPPLLAQGLEQEVAMLREELDAIRGELAALRQDMHQELSHMRATQTVSPIYGDAMHLATAGYDPAVIAERCGIARAEAELVVALAKSQER